MADQADDKAVILARRLKRLESQRSTWESHWQEVADYMRPRKADITKKRSAGDKRAELIFDGTAIHAAELLAASLHGMLTNSSTTWFSLKFREPDLQDDDTAKEWLEKTEVVMYDAFARSNFQEQIHELYDDLILFGTGVMFIEADDINDIRFSTRHISECYVSEDENGRVDTVFRRFKMTAQACVNKFEKVSEKIQRIAERDPYEEVMIAHAVYPRDQRDTMSKAVANMAFASCYFDEDAKIIMQESGFNEFPYCVPRWLKSSFELGYGRSCGMSSLSDVKMLNKFSEITIRAAQKQVDPPLMVPDDGFMAPIRTVPGGLNFYRSGTRDRIEPLNIGANNPLGLAMEEQRRQAIRSAFYVDQLITGQGPTMTATEVIQRTEEKMRLLGPVLGRLQAELLQPLIKRVYNLLSLRRQLPETPDFMQGSDIEIEYVSPLAQAQKHGDVQSVVRLLEMLQPLMGISPDIIDYIDNDGLAKHVLRILGVPATVIRGSEEIEDLRDERQVQQMEQAQQQQQMMEAEAAGKAAPALAVANDAAQQEMQMEEAPEDAEIEEQIQEAI